MTSDKGTLTHLYYPNHHHYYRRVPDEVVVDTDAVARIVDAAVQDQIHYLVVIDERTPPACFVQLLCHSWDLIDL